MKSISHSLDYVLLILALVLTSCNNKKATLAPVQQLIQAQAQVRPTFTTIPTLQVTNLENCLYPSTYVMICGMYIPF